MTTCVSEATIASACWIGCVAKRLVAGTAEVSLLEDGRYRVRVNRHESIALSVSEADTALRCALPAGELGDSVRGALVADLAGCNSIKAKL